MVHSEIIRVYNIIQIPDGYGGSYEQLTLADDAPIFATINPTSGSIVDIAGLQPVNYDFTVYCNHVDGFEWMPNMVIDSDVYGFMQIGSIQEDLNEGARGQNRSRRRMWQLTANKMKQDQWQNLLPSQ